MGYHVTILRTRDGQLNPITKSEIESLLRSWPGSTINPDTRNNDVLNIVIEKNGKEVSWLTFYSKDGILWTKNPEKAEVAVMLEIASQLGARVRGDEYETYRSPTETYFDPEDLEEKKKAEKESRALLREEFRLQQKIKWGFILAFLLLATIAFVLGKMFETH